MKLKEYIKEKGFTSYTLAKVLTNGESKNEFENNRQWILYSMRRDEKDSLTLSHYQRFADALKVSLKELLFALGRLA